MAIFLPDSPANVEARKISHSQRAHGHAKIVEGAVHRFNGRSFFEKEHRLTNVGMEHAVTHKAAAIADHHPDFAELFRKLHAGANYFLAVCLPPDNFYHPHHVAVSE